MSDMGVHLPSSTADAVPLPPAGEGSGQLRRGFAGMRSRPGSIRRDVEDAVPYDWEPLPLPSPWGERFRTAAVRIRRNAFVTEIVLHGRPQVARAAESFVTAVFQRIHTAPT